MNTADRLRQELVTIQKDKLMEKVCSAIRSCGYFTICWDKTTHLSNTVAYLSSHDLHTALDWVRAEGFRVIKEGKSWFIEL